MSRGLRGAACALAALASWSCRFFASPAPPPAARGVVLVLAAGLDSAATGEHAPALRRLASEGRPFARALATTPDPVEARVELLAATGSDLPSLCRARGAAVAGIGGQVALGLPASAFDLALPRDGQGGFEEARLSGWLREQRGRFLLVAAIGAEPDAPAAPPAAAQGESAPPLPRIAVNDLAFEDRPGGLVRPAAWSLSARRRAEATALDRAAVADAALGRLLVLVERDAPGAAVVVVGDPPPDRGQHGVLLRRALFEDSLRVTLVVATPGLSRGGRAARGLVSTRDVAPTLLELAGLAPQEGLAGASLMPLLADPDADGRAEVLSSVARQAGRVGRSARDGRFRYTEWPDGSSELYDHDADPHEHVNLVQRGEHAQAAAVLARAFERRTGAAGASAASSVPGLERAGAGVRGARPRNVVLIIVDDLNTRLGAWGAPVRTPHIDRLAARGVRFDRAYAQVAMCSPSRTSLLTGLAPLRTGVWHNLDPPRPAGALPLQELFAAHGARTAAVGKVYHGPAEFPFDLREDQPPGPWDEEEEAEEETRQDALFAVAEGGDLSQPDGRRARRAAQILERRDSRPLFLALGLVRPHQRWVAPRRYFALYPPESLLLDPFPQDDLADVPAIAVKTRPQPLPGLPLRGREPAGVSPDPERRRLATAAYQACVSFADAQVGVVLDALDRRRSWAETVVVLVGDNGFHLGEHGGMLRKDTLFEQALHVPLVVAAPGLPAGAVVREPVELLDVYPTIVELAGLPAPAGIDGSSLVPLALGASPGRGPALSYRRVRPPERAHSIRTAEARYTLWPDGSEELYDLRSRRGESANLASEPSHQRLKRDLRARLVERVAAGR